MMREIDIRRSAKFLIAEHGDNAAFHAAMRITELIDAGDGDGVVEWNRIMRAVEELLATGGGTVH